MMYDVLLQIIETFLYNDGKIYNPQLKNNINESIYGEKYPITLQGTEADTKITWNY